jgi:hypothetical protein
MLFTCDNAPDGARGYSHTFMATVTNSRFYGGWGVRGNIDSVMFDGVIATDGSVTLTATGLTGNTIYNAGHVAQGTPVVFHMIGHFTADHGEGHRIELRPCTMDITRR